MTRTIQTKAAEQQDRRDCADDRQTKADRDHGPSHALRLALSGHIADGAQQPADHGRAGRPAGLHDNEVEGEQSRFKPATAAPFDHIDRIGQ